MGLCFTTKKKNKERSNWRTTKSSYYWTITGFYGRLFTFHLLFSTLAELKTSLIIERSENMKQNTNINLLTVKATGACTWGPIWVRSLSYSRGPLRTNKGCCQSPISWLLFGKGGKGGKKRAPHTGWAFSCSLWQQMNQAMPQKPCPPIVDASAQNSEQPSGIHFNFTPGWFQTIWISFEIRKRLVLVVDSGHNHLSRKKEPNVCKHAKLQGLISITLIL